MNSIAKYHGPESGVALVETALTLPLLLLLLLSTVNFGLYIYGWVTVNNAARAAVEYAIYNGVAVDFPVKATFSQIQVLVNNDVSSLPGYSAGTNPTLEVCNPVCSAGPYSPPPDPEPNHRFAIYSADVAYTYRPLFSGFNIPRLGIYLTLPPTVIHRQVVMRSMQ
jgi:TadE-like protein